MTTILIWHPEGDDYAQALRARRPDLAVSVARDEDDFARRVCESDVLLGTRFPLGPLRAPARPRWIHVTSAGAEFLAPLRDALTDVVVTNARGVHGAPIAEYVLAAMVMLHSGFAEYGRAQAQRRWARRPVGTLDGKTLVVLGTGAIGGAIARRAHALGMQVLGVSRGGGAVDGCARTYSTARMTDALGSADFLAVTLPLTDVTRGLVDDAAFAAMKPGGFLINVSRGGVVDEAALLRALDARHLAGACLDVFAQEPLPPESPWWSRPDVIVTPHIAGWRDDYVERVLDGFLDNLDRHAAGLPLANRFDLARGY